MSIHIRQAIANDVELVSAILLEAAAWLESRNMPMWRANELLPARISKDLGGGLFFLAEAAGEPAGTVKFQLSDLEFWPDVPEDDSAFVHRLAVGRRYAGGAVSSALLSWALERTAALGRKYLRLDCEASRPRLRAVYERFGFQHHSDRQVGPYLVSRYQIDVSGVGPRPRAIPDTQLDLSRADHLRRSGVPATKEPGGRRLIADMHLATCQVRSWREADAQSLASHANNRRVWINLRDRFPHPYTLADAHTFIRTALTSTETLFAIAVDGAAVGGIGFTLHDDVERVSAEIGYWLGEAHWGRGIMTEAVAAVTTHAMRTHRLTRVFAVPFAWNAASCRVLEKVGYVYEGRMSRSAIKDGQVIDQLLYGYIVK